jgi:hypothetical protein
MKKFILSLLILICFTGLLYAKDDNYLYIYQHNKIIGKFTIEQFKSLVEGADKYKEIITAQKEKRLLIISEEVLPLDKDNTYKTNIRIIWQNREQKEINYIVSELILNIDNDKSNNIPEWRIYYRNISEVGFPICGSFLILFLILLL